MPFGFEATADEVTAGAIGTISRVTGDRQQTAVTENGRHPTANDRWWSTRRRVIEDERRIETKSKALPDRATSDRMEIDPETSDPSEIYRLMTSVVVPRPIGWISTVSEDGTDNLAPYSYFNAVSSSPAVLMFSAGTHDGERKDTPTNAIESGEFVFNLVTEAVAKEMDETSASLPTGESEFEAAGIERAESTVVEPPRVAAAKASFECTLYDSMQVYDNTMVLGEVRYAHVDDDLLTDGKPDSLKIDAVGRLGGPYYTSLDVMDLQRGY